MKRNSGPIATASETAALQFMLRAVGGPSARSGTALSNGACRDEDLSHAMATIRHLRGRLNRWTIWKYLDGLHFDRVWPRRLRRKSPAGDVTLR